MSGGSRRAYAEDNISGSANVSYNMSRTRSGADRQSSWDLIQRYGVDLSKDLTPNLDLAAGLDASESKTVTKTGIGDPEPSVTEETRTTTLAPDLRLTLDNDFFNADTGYRTTEKGLNILHMSTKEARHTSESWDMGFTSNLKKYPGLQLDYNEDRSYDYLDVQERNTKSTSFSGSTDYSFQFLDFSYDYKRSTSKDHVSEIFQVTDSHDKRVNFTKSFWEDKITSSGSYSMGSTKTKITKSDQDSFTASITGSLPDLRDEDKDTATGINIGGSANNINRLIGFDLGDKKNNINTVSIYTEEEYDLLATDFDLKVYWYDDSEEKHLTTNATTVYNKAGKNCTIDFDQVDARYFVVESDVSTNTNINITEIEALDTLAVVYVPDRVYTISEDMFTAKTESETETKSTSRNMQLNLGYKAFEWLSFLYGYSQDREQSEPGPTKTKSTSQTMGVSAEKDFNRYFNTSANYQRRTQYALDEKTTSTDTSSVRFGSSPLDTVDVGLSLSKTGSRTESDTQSKSSSALLNVAATLREGADLDVDANIIDNHNIPGKTRTVTRSLNTNLGLDLTRTLKADLKHDDTWITTDESSSQTSEHTSSYETALNWRP
ncbi:MAG: hypothetical protein SVS15_01755, partial [Thermodesulfobacteriota bacterium]|nr:hypothetical protein [Thermodesulfobacteriota bacterium]